MKSPATRPWNGLIIPTPGTYLLDPAHHRIGFVAMHMMVSPVRGSFREVSAKMLVGEDPFDSSVTATIQAASIDTGHPERDAHLRSPDFLDVERYPTLEFRSTEGRWPAYDDPIFHWAKLRNSWRRPSVTRQADPLPTGPSDRFVVLGELTIKGMTRQVELDAQFGGARRDPNGQDIIGLSAITEIDREDYGLVWNVALANGGWLVGKKVRIELAGEAIRQV